MFVESKFLLLIVGFLMVDAQNCPKNQDVLEYFKGVLPGLEEDLSLITWHHAVNTEEALKQALASDKHMIESDVVHIVKEGKVIPVMGHDVDKADDRSLTFENFLHLFNKRSNDKLKGLKLDFKSTEGFQSAIDLNIINFQNVPVWINADILKGPGGSEPRVDMSYQRNKHQMDCHTLSIGWTTGKLQANLRYSKDEIDSMVKTRFGTQPRTYPVRAAYLPESWNDFNDVLLSGENNKDTLTVWCPEDDKDIIVAKDLKKVLQDNKKRIYLDIPDSIRKMIDDVPNASGSLQSNLVLAVISAILMIVIIL